MRIGLLTSSIGNIALKGFYNLQEIGLAKALDTIYDEVVIYKCVSIDEKSKKERIELCNNTTIMYLPTKCIGNNGKVDVRLLDKSLDVLVYFSDTQLSVPKVYKWAQKNHVIFIPYIGVIESHSTSSIKKVMIDFLFKRNLNVYKKSHCMVKTPKVKEDLASLGVEKITIAPVGLDLGLMKTDYRQFDTSKLKEKYGYASNDKLLLFIGRLTNEKQPLKMIEIFSKITAHDSNYKLIMVGKGELQNQILSLIEKNGLMSSVQMIESIPNSEIWELYRISEAFINLNKQEIFGMALLEAMYYECKVVAWEAPGPNYIINSGNDGYLVANEEQVIAAILEDKEVCEKGHMKVVENFTWDITANEIKLIGELIEKDVMD